MERTRSSRCNGLTPLAMTSLLKRRQNPHCVNGIDLISINEGGNIRGRIRDNAYDLACGYLIADIFGCLIELNTLRESILLLRTQSSSSDGVVQFIVLNSR